VTPEKPRIAILGGTGQEGRGLSARWSRAGYRVVIGSRDPAKAQAVAEELNRQIGTGLISGKDLAGAARAGDIAVLAVPFAAQAQTLTLVKAELSGKILIDVTVPLVPPKVSRVQLPDGGSAVLKAQALLGSEVKVVSAFQNISFEALQQLDQPIDCDVLVCGDDAAARETVIGLAQAAGMQAWHAGPLVNSTAVEALTSLLIFMNIRYKSHRAGIRATGVTTESSARRLQLVALQGLPEVQPGDDLPALLLSAAQRSGEQIQNGDVIILAQKIVSKAEGRYVRLGDVTPSARAKELARSVSKDPRLIELVLQESTDVLRHRQDVIVVEHLRGFILANAGIDASNVALGGEDEYVLLLPKDPDASAHAIRTQLERATGKRLGVVINDSLGRAWRKGTVGTALGASGLTTLRDLRGHPDRRGRKLRATEVGVGDEVAAAASLLMGQADEGSPAVLLRGFPYELGNGNCADLIRPKVMDLFR
jgi:coenzyme F420-0:L-glutamate ligase/coenzyme F420-1:gamma-L-glutamate ligase